VNTFSQVKAEEIKNMIDQNQDLVLLDVRSPEEYARNRIQKSVNLPYETITRDIGELVPDKKTKIVVYCLSGSRSVVAAQSLIEAGYLNIFNMENGLLGWRAIGFPLE
jgi:rhodanese-related sulfurtransferase